MQQDECGCCFRRSAEGGNDDDEHSLKSIQFKKRVERIAVHKCFELTNQNDNKCPKIDCDRDQVMMVKDALDQIKSIG